MRRKKEEENIYKEELEYGVTYDDYSEESGNPNFENGEDPIFPNDNLTDEELAKLSGEVRVIRSASKK